MKEVEVLIWFRISKTLAAKLKEEAKLRHIPKSGFLSLLVESYFDGIKFERKKEEGGKQE